MKWPRAVKAKNSEVAIFARLTAAVAKAAVQRPSRVRIMYAPTSSDSKKAIAPCHEQRASAGGKANEFDELLMRGRQTVGRVVDQPISIRSLG
jgi:hypothetical protein